MQAIKRRVYPKIFQSQTAFMETSWTNKKNFLERTHEWAKIRFSFLWLFSFGHFKFATFLLQIPSEKAWRNSTQVSLSASFLLIPCVTPCGVIRAHVTSRWCGGAVVSTTSPLRGQSGARFPARSLLLHCGTSGEPAKGGTRGNAVPKGRTCTGCEPATTGCVKSDIHYFSDGQFRHSLLLTLRLSCATMLKVVSGPGIEHPTALSGGS